MIEDVPPCDALCNDTTLAGMARREADGILADAAAPAAWETLFQRLGTLGECAVEARKAQRPPPSPIVCRKDCDSCCYMRVVATIPEIVAVVAHVKETFSADQIAALRERIAAAVGTGPKMYDEEWGVRGIACPFLVEGNCSIYPARPLECRGYNSMNLDACLAAREHYLDWEVPMYMPEFTAYKQIQAGILQALENAGLPASIVELGAAVEAVLAEDSVLDEWAGGAAAAFEVAELEPYDPDRRAFLPWTPSDEVRGFDPDMEDG